ncbi:MULTISPECIES: histidine kinase [Hymenobacter]|jgi:signal transduction histidine kinase|uniref:Histidine kinase n=2 Tax=Hymenobacter TaxID=89966 RepID=A0A939JEX5_9BACT|nr:MULTISPECIES: histidine kinase [Hymenobacter]MBW3376430.1 histidine kinase [Hymenobacter norwichensis]MBJ6111261.1 histidine kinase [Hymenobacter sp. BT523]MBO0360403.1 histidine kinase [Hymenobacter telluris]MCC2548928.1 histidine kinase [Hymenobacter translucens]UPL51358.1 histidine kinase [Hymenobacter sublimis]
MSTTAGPLKTPQKTPPLVSGATIALAWLLFSGFMVLLIFVQNLSAGTPTDWREALGGRLLHGLIWGLLTPVVFALAARFNLLESRHRLRHLLAHAAASYVLTLAYRLVYAAVMHGSGAVPGRVSLAEVVANANSWVPIYWMLLCIAYAVQYRERYREGRVRAAQLETQLVQAQLQALKMQLQPHFLFNSMNAVSALMSQDVKAARRMLAQLSQFLRLVLEGTDEQEVTLEQELRLTRLYLEIEQTRFPDRLAVRYNIAPDTEGALLPALLLQPVVENAVRHGLAPRAGAGELAVRAEKQGDRLLLQVQDNGRGAADTAARGIGLRNLESRLATLYGPDYALAVESAPACGYCLRLSIPFRRAVAGVTPEPA